MGKINIQNCDQLSIDNNWDLVRENACHIGNMNEEMGVLAQSQTDTLSTINVINVKIGFILWIFTIISLALFSLVIKKMWGKQ